MKKIYQILDTAFITK